MKPMFAGLTPAHIIVAQCDIVHDEGVKFAKRLADIGGKVTITEYKNVPHGFMSMACTAPQLGLKVDEGDAAIAEIVQKLHMAYEAV